MTEGIITGTERVKGGERDGQVGETQMTDIVDIVAPEDRATDLKQEADLVQNHLIHVHEASHVLISYVN